MNIIPRRDGTGQMGMGPMTGRGMGYCAGYAMPGYPSPGFGMGREIGFQKMIRIFGFGRHFRVPARGAGHMRWY